MGRESNKKRRATNEQTARARAAAMRMEQQRAARRRQLGTVGVAVVVAVAVIAAIVVIAVNNGNKPVTTTGLNKPLSALQVSDIASVSDATFTSVGTSTSDLATQYLPQKTPAGTPAVTGANGKPEVTYIGAEFCPYCAAERWALAVALDRFGTLSGLETMHSSPDDTDPNTPTISFRDTSYSSSVLSFAPVENETINHTALQSPTAAQQKLWTLYTYACSSDGCGDSYPFIDFGGKYVVTGPTFDPGVLAGLSQATITADLDNPSSPVAKAIDGTANYLTSAMCGMTGDKPASVCTPAITALASHFATAATPGAKQVAGGSASPTTSATSK